MSSFSISSRSSSGDSGLQLRGSERIEHNKFLASTGQSFDDCEKGLPVIYDPPVLVPGYPAVANRMGELPQQSIFRRFATLGNQNLLYMQAELMKLERELRQLEVEDSQSGREPRNKYARSHGWVLIEKGPQYETILKIRSKLKTYCKSARVLFR